MRTLTLFKAASALCRMLPMGAVPPLAGVAGRLVAALARPQGLGQRAWARSGAAQGARRELVRQWSTVARNQARVHDHTHPCCPLGERALRRAVREAYASYARYWMESLVAPHLTPFAIESGFSFTGVGHAETAMSAGRGLIFALPHLGCWDYAGSWLARAELRPAVVVEALEPQEVFDWFCSLRENLGMEVIAADAGAVPKVLAALRRNQAVCLPCDRDLSGAGVEVRFFGERTTMPAGPALLALKTGAALLPTAVYYDQRRGGHRGVVLAPLEVRREGRLREDIARITQELAHRFEELVSCEPTQWHLFQPNWPSDRAALDLEHERSAGR